MGLPSPRRRKFSQGLLSLRVSMFHLLKIKALWLVDLALLPPTQDQVKVTNSPLLQCNLVFPLHTLTPSF